MSKIRIEIENNKADIYRDGEWFGFVEDLSGPEGYKSDLDELLAQANDWIRFKLQLERQSGQGSIPTSGHLPE